MIGQDALGTLALGELLLPPSGTGSNPGRWMGRRGKVRRVEDLPLVLDFEPDEDFDLGVVVGLWMQYNKD